MSFVLVWVLVVAVKKYVSVAVFRRIQQPTSCRLVGVQRARVCAQRFAACACMTGSAIISVSEGNRTLIVTGPTVIDSPSAFAKARTRNVPAMRAVHLFPAIACQSP